MRKSIIFVLASVAMLTACNNGPKRAELISQNDSLRNVILERDASLDEMIATINVVEDGFRAINEAQGHINLNAIGEERNADKIKANFEFINNTLTKNKEEIERLQKQLASSRTNSKQMQAMLDKLQAQLAEKVSEIEELHKTLEQKNIKIAELDKNVAQLTEKGKADEKKISEQDAQLNTVWYVVGTKRELKNENILKSGKVLHASEANTDYFTKADMREVTSIATHAKKAKVLTVHPEGSYSLVRDANKMYTLNILDAEAFWSVSRYLVIQVR